MTKKVIIIGGGFGGLGSAILMAKEGYDVTVYEKNTLPGGRANILEKDGFRWDMGPSRYLMPDVFEHFFASIGENVSDYLDLIKLDPSYRIWFKDIAPQKPVVSINFYNQPTWDKIIQGTKTIETRALNPEEPERYFGNVQRGDTIEYINKLTDERMCVKVMEQYIWKNFAELASTTDEVLSAIGCDLSQDIHHPDILKQGRNFSPDYIERIEKNGLVGWKFEILLQQHLVVDITGDVEKDAKTFESIQQGSGEQLKKYLNLAKEQYEIAMQKFVYKNYNSLRDFLDRKVMTKARKLHIFDKMDRYVSRFFTSPELKKIMEYTMLFLGTSPYEAPALFNIMSHVDFGLGVYYPQGGIHEIPKALLKIAQKYGVKFVTSKEVTKIIVDNQKVSGVEFADGGSDSADIIISNADMRHTETALLEPEYQTYPESYRTKKVISPSAFILYLGVQGSLPQLTHHNLIFAKDWEAGYDQIFHNPKLPDDPSLYICKPTQVDPSVAPAGHENLFVLVPIAPGLQFNQAQQDEYTQFIIDFVAKQCAIPDLSKRIVSQTIFSVKEFASTYNSYKGTALGLAHTLFQSAIRRPNNHSKKVSGLYYAGSYTNPGIGMPMCLISAMLVKDTIIGK